MTYEEALDWLYNQVSNYQTEGEKAYKPGLKSITNLAKSYNNPHHNFPSIHIAGTNGKGSTAHMLSSIFQEAGYKVGLFSSPHLISFTERIKINGNEIEKEFVHQFILNFKDKKLTESYSFFEITTLLAFVYFSFSKIDIAIIETGLGGRLDSTNILHPILSIITSIDYDHQHLLGNTLEEIAYEKAGIIKPNIPVVCGEEKPKAQEVIKHKAKELKSPFFLNNITNIYPSDLKGAYQIQNQKTVQKAISLLAKDWNISQTQIKNGLLNVVKNTNFKGRWQIYQQNPTIILDVAHNYIGIQKAMEQLLSIQSNKLHIVLGFLKGKDIEGIIKILPKEADYYFVTPKNPRALLSTEYKELANHLNASFYANVEDGFVTATKAQKEGEILFVGGSNFVIAEILEKKNKNYL